MILLLSHQEDKIKDTANFHLQCLLRQQLFYHYLRNQNVPSTFTERYYPFYNCRPNDAGDLDWESSKDTADIIEEKVPAFFFSFLGIYYSNYEPS